MSESPAADSSLVTLLTQLTGEVHQLRGDFVKTTIGVEVLAEQMKSFREKLDQAVKGLARIEDLDDRVHRLEDRQFTPEQHAMILRGIDTMQRSPSLEPLSQPQYEQIMEVARTGLSSGAAKKFGELERKVAELEGERTEREAAETNAANEHREIKMLLIGGGASAVLLVLAEAAGKALHFL